MRNTLGWDRRLIEYIRAAEGRPFSWGHQDCALFACGAIEAAFGCDPAEAFRGTYHDQDSAIRMLHAYSGGGLEATAAMVCDARGWPEIAPETALSGDLGIVTGGPLGPSLAVCYGWDWVAQGEDGLIRISDLALGARAWAVCR